MHRKRNRSASLEEAAPTKTRRTSPSAASPPSPPIPTLHLSSLIWQWDSEPCTVSVEYGGDPQLLGRYVVGPDRRVTAATSTSWSSEHNAFVYTPIAPMTMCYTRRTFVGTASSDVTYYGAIAGMYDGDEGQTIGPLLRLHGVNEAAFPEELPEPDLPNDVYGGDRELFNEIRRRDRENEGEYWDEDDDQGRPNCGPGPPYDFYDTDWLGEGERAPQCIGAYALNLDEPDLPGQGQEDHVVLTESDNDEVEPDGAEWNGWHGAWVGELLNRQTRKVEQDTRTSVQWRDWGEIVGLKIVHESMWGVEVEFRPKSFETYKPYKDSKHDKNPTEAQTNLSGYTVEATVRRVFVTPKWFEIHQHEHEKKPTAGEAD
ncbi:hypothetical protein AURDEDRAFT_143687 [Auricularia subglabra TFB-10046 SS5]|nr:hypothetical protein AURDEDRAFT_143687 [Auricularia subglabra TFB-10046 SS5]